MSRTTVTFVIARFPQSFLENRGPRHILVDEQNAQRGFTHAQCAGSVQRLCHRAVRLARMMRCARAHRLHDNACIRAAAALLRK